MSRNESSDTKSFFPINSFVREKPKLLFMIMVVTIIASIILTAILEVTEKPADKKRLSPVSGLTRDFSEMSGSVFTISEVISLKKEISQLLEKDSLSHTDSLRMLEAFQKLEKLNRKLNSQKR